jgi:pimeloyl-ACP methyl ester carboxylesterase
MIFGPIDDQEQQGGQHKTVKLEVTRSLLESRMLHINGIALHVILAGPPNGTPIIFLHGFPEFWFAWRRQIDHFASAGYRVVIPDQRGYNLSDKPAGLASYSLDVLAKDVVGILDAVGGSKGFVVGHDWGAAVTWYLAARHPDRIRRAAILSVPHPRVLVKNLSTNPAQMGKSWYIFFFQLPWLPELLVRRRDWSLLTEALRNTPYPDMFSDSDLAKYKESWAKKGAVTAMLNWYRAALMCPPRLMFDLKASQIKVPTLLVWGEHEQFAVEEMATESLQHCEQGRLRIFDGASHWVHHEQPVRLNNLLSEFFAEPEGGD